MGTDLYKMLGAKVAHEPPTEFTISDRRRTMPEQLMEKLNWFVDLHMINGEVFRVKMHTPPPEKWSSLTRDQQQKYITEKIKDMIAEGEVEECYIQPPESAAGFKAYVSIAMTVWFSPPYQAVR